MGTKEGYFMPRMRDVQRWLTSHTYQRWRGRMSQKQWVQPVSSTQKNGFSQSGPRRKQQTKAL